MNSKVSVLDRAVRILHLEDNALDRALIREMLEQEGFATEIILAGDRAEFLSALQHHSFDIILSDKTLPGFDGLEALHLAKEFHPDLPFVFVSGSMGEGAAIDTIKDGATDYVLKDRLNRLIPAMERAIREADQAQKNRLATSALRESEERFQLIARASNDVIWDWNIESGSFWQSQGIRHFGYGDADIHPGQRPLLDHIQADHQERVLTSLDRILQSREQYWSDEYPFLRHDGGVAHVFNRGYVIRDALGKAIRMVGAMMDITERKLAEQLTLERTDLAALRAEVAGASSGAGSLAESLEQCSEAVARRLDAALVRIWLLDGAGKMLLLQASAGPFAHSNGIHKTIPVGVTRVGRVAGGGKPIVNNYISEDTEDGDCELARRERLPGFGGYPLAGGKLAGVIAIYSHQPITDFGAEAMGVVSREIALGIERRQAGDKIREQAALLDQAQDAIFVPSLNQQIRYWNKSAERLYGWTSAEVLGQDVTHLLFKTESPALLVAREAILKQGEWSGEFTQVTKSGKEIIVKSLWSLVRDPAGQPEAILIVNTDITEKKKLEAQFLRAQRLESIGALASGIAHDLNNVLSPILIGVPFLKEQIQDKSCLKILSAMESSASRGAGIVKQVLTFARGATEERMPLQPQQFINEIVKIIGETFPKSIQIKTDLERKLWDIEGDPTQIHQVLLNLCVNARDAMPKGGMLTIAARNVILQSPVSRAGLTGVSGPYVQIKVIDTGMGIPLEIQEQIFQPFFTTKELHKGTGLGLSTTVSILQSHGGVLELTSTPGQGTTFLISFPAMTPAAHIEPPPRISTMPSGAHELILLVDDEVAIREMCKMMLESCDYRVVTAENGADALTILDRHKDEISAVIIDMMMPVMDGPTAVRAMRWSEPNLKIIATSGLSEKEQSSAGEIKADRFLQKPYTADQLLTALGSLLGKTKP